jgi:hypothetical protein
LITFAGFFSVASLLSWTATVVCEAGLLLPAPRVATATGVLLTFTGAFCAAADLNGSDFTEATGFAELPEADGFAETAATWAAGVVTTAGLAGTATVFVAAGAAVVVAVLAAPGFTAATATGFAEAGALVLADATATAFGWALAD